MLAKPRWITALAFAALAAPVRAEQDAVDRVDRDADGTIEQREFEAFEGQVPPSERPSFADLDVDRDGRLTRAEALTLAPDAFGTADVDQDGRVDAQELRDFESRTPASPTPTSDATATRPSTTPPSGFEPEVPGRSGTKPPVDDGGRVRNPGVTFPVGADAPRTNPSVTFPNGADAPRTNPSVTFPSGTAGSPGRTTGDGASPSAGGSTSGGSTSNGSTGGGSAGASSGGGAGAGR